MNDPRESTEGSSYRVPSHYRLLNVPKWLHNSTMASFRRPPYNAVRPDFPGTV
jgi:hypothetical protein